MANKLPLEKGGYGSGRKFSGGTKKKIKQHASDRPLRERYEKVANSVHDNLKIIEGRVYGQLETQDVNKVNLNDLANIDKKLMEVIDLLT